MSDNISVATPIEILVYKKDRSSKFYIATNLVSVSSKFAADSGLIGYGRIGFSGQWNWRSADEVRTKIGEKRRKGYVTASIDDVMYLSPAIDALAAYIKSKDDGVIDIELSRAESFSGWDLVLHFSDEQADGAAHSAAEPLDMSWAGDW